MTKGRGVSAASGDAAADEVLATAQALLEQARAEAERRREDADRYVRQREEEAAVLVAKARRVLRAAEEKAGVIIAVARAQALGTVGLRDGEADDEEVGRVIAPAAARLHQDGQQSRLDRLLATAIESAVDDTFSRRASA